MGWNQKARLRKVASSLESGQGSAATRTFRAFGGNHHMHHRLIKPTLLSVILASTLQGMAFAQQPPEEPAPPPADAEAGADAAQAPTAKELDAVTVVGSRLASNRVEGPSPVLV